ncbi:MAG: hypothetical protein Q9160_007349 [Pyrenula sp. 1 TL-2023]
MKQRPRQQIAASHDNNRHTLTISEGNEANELNAMIVGSDTNFEASPVEIENTYLNPFDTLPFPHQRIRSADSACDVNDLQRQDSPNPYCPMMKSNHPTTITSQTRQESGSDKLSAPSIVSDWTMDNSASISLDSTSDVIAQWEEALSSYERSMTSQPVILYPLPDSKSPSTCRSFLEQCLPCNQNGLAPGAPRDQAKAIRDDAALSLDLLDIPIDEFDTPEYISHPRDVCPNSWDVDIPSHEGAFLQYDPKLWLPHAEGSTPAHIPTGFNVQVLHEAVNVLKTRKTCVASAKTDQSPWNAALTGIPWKQVGEYIRERGGYLFAKKPKPQNESETKHKPKPDPFLNPPSALLVASIPRQRPSHILVLNKYPIITRHFILATKAVKAQTDLLEEDDLACTFSCLRAWQEDGTSAAGRLFAFYNSGEHSGASQPHRHVQFLPIEDMYTSGDKAGWEPLIDCVAVTASNEVQRQPIPSLPFLHFAKSLPEEPSSSQLLETYTNLYKAAEESVLNLARNRTKALDGTMTDLAEAKISYNLAMTTSTMVICPRLSEGIKLLDGEEESFVALNGTVLAGTMMVKTVREWNTLREDADRLETILRAIGVPVGQNLEGQRAKGILMQKSINC